jgi:hypothetical protein
MTNQQTTCAPTMETNVTISKITRKPTKLVYRHQWSTSKMKWENTNQTHPN